MLNLNKIWSKIRFATIEANIHFKEWLHDLFGCITTSADSLLHLVERVLSGVKKGLVHGPRVVLGEFLDLLGTNRLNMLVKSV